jgi:hypothetical protein
MSGCRVLGTRQGRYNGRYRTGALRIVATGGKGCSASHMLSTKPFDERHNGLTVFPKLLLVRNSALYNHVVVIDHPPWSLASECREYICAAASLLSCRLQLCACSFCRMSR